MRTRSRQSKILRLILILSSLILLHASSNANKNLILRVRRLDGTVERVTASSDDTLGDILKPFHENQDSISVLLHAEKVSSLQRPLSELGIANGALLSLQEKDSNRKKKGLTKQARPSYQTSTANRWSPYPDLAKDLGSAVTRLKKRRAQSRSNSYGDLSHIQSEMHVVEAQNKGPIERFYMCHKAATDVQSHAVGKGVVANRVAMLFGSIHQERVHAVRKARTSLSSTTDDEDYCQVCKVHALWELPNGGPSNDALSQADLTRATRIGASLDLVPVGWIYTYDDDRHADDDALPVLAQDIVTGARLQMQQMRERGRDDGQKFVTLAMHATEGATEAFQLSNVAVQMAAEGILSKEMNGRHVTTTQNVLVDGRETTQLDTVLCLVNTALLSHDGTYVRSNCVKKNGALTSKTKKALRQALEDDNDGRLLTLLCDLRILMKMDESLTAPESQRLCSIVKKWARGQKKTTTLDKSLKRRLEALLDH